MDPSGGGQQRTAPERASHHSGRSGSHSLDPGTKPARGEPKANCGRRKDGQDLAGGPVRGCRCDHPQGRGQAGRPHAINVDATNGDVDRVGRGDSPPAIGRGSVDWGGGSGLRENVDTGA